MADGGIGELAVVSSLAGAGFKAAGDITKAQGTKAGDEFRAQQLDRSASYGRIAADQTGAQLGEQLNTTLQNIDVIRSAGGVDPTSPTSVAVRGLQEKLGDRQINIQTNNILRQANEDTISAAYLRKAGSDALMQGYLSAGADVAGAVGQGVLNYNKSKPTGT